MQKYIHDICRQYIKIHISLSSDGLLEHAQQSKMSTVLNNDVKNTLKEDSP